MTLLSAQRSAAVKSDCSTSSFAFHSVFDRWTVRVTYCRERFWSEVLETDIIAAKQTSVVKKPKKPKSKSVVKGKSKLVAKGKAPVEKEVADKVREEVAEQLILSDTDSNEDMLV